MKRTFIISAKMTESDPSLNKDLPIKGGIESDFDLPRVSLDLEFVDYLENPENIEYLNIINSEDEIVGRFEIANPRIENPSQYAHIYHVQTYKRGYLKSGYIELANYLGDKKLRSGAIGPATQHVWEWMVKNGLAKKLPSEELEFETL